VQLRFPTGLTSEEYVNGQAWLDATLERCPFHPKGGCGFAKLGTYPRVEPPGTQIPRWYCPKEHTSVSLLADCFASRLSGTLVQLEQVVDHVEHEGVTLGARLSRGQDVELPGAIRWTRLRAQYVWGTLTILIGLTPELFKGCQPTLASFRVALGTDLVLPRLREIAAVHLRSLASPIGLCPRRVPHGFSCGSFQHETGAVPTPKPP